ncbi:MAG: methionine synthase [Propionibacteriaceae bacterium]|nr:methionine synthase [Propionibacteriaceae bacterium]
MANLRAALGNRLLVADGAMGTQLLKHKFTSDDFEGHQSCFELLNVTRPDVIAGIHRSYLAAGADCVETNTFGVNFGSLGDHGLVERAFELAQAAAAIARQVADEFDRRFVLGSLGPGTKLPTLQYASYGELRDVYEQAAAGLIAGGADGFQIETCQDLLQAKAAVVGARRALAAAGRELPVLVNVTFESNGAMLLGTDILAALTALSHLGVDGIGLNCGTGPAEMAGHLRTLAANTGLPLVCMPNAGLPELTAAGAIYPLGPEEFAAQVLAYAAEFGLSLIGGCCGTTPAHIAALAQGAAAAPAPKRGGQANPAVSSLYSAVELRQDVSYLSIGERANANGSKAFREALLGGDLDECVDIAREQAHTGAHVVDVCVDFVGRDSAADMSELAAGLAVQVPLPVMLDSTDAEVLRAGLERLGGRCVINSVSFEDGGGPGSRFAKTCALAKEHGAAVLALAIDERGQARTRADKVEVAERLIARLNSEGFADSDILMDCLTFPIATGQEETRRDAAETLDAVAELSGRHPELQLVLGVSNVSFGLSAPARQVLNSVFLHEAVAKGLTAAILNPARIIPLAQIPAEQARAALDLVYDRRADGYDPLAALLAAFDGVEAEDSKQSQAAELASLPVAERLRRRIVLGAANGLEADLEAALAERPALEIINDELLGGMREVGELFGGGRMQLPFVLQSAETMKRAVDLLQPHLAHADTPGRGTLVLATVAGDVHDIGKNLVDIILSNNGFQVVNLGIKQQVEAIASAAAEHHAAAIGMSGLLVKSTQVMRNNLRWLAEHGFELPVILGGAALTREYVESELQALYPGPVRYAQDAFEGLRLLESFTAAQAQAAAQPRPPDPRPESASVPDTVRSDAVARGLPVPQAPFTGARQLCGIGLREVAAYLDERMLFAGQWGLRPRKDGPAYEELAETEGRPRLARWLDHIEENRLAEFAVAYGYFHCYSEGNSLILPEPGVRFDFPRQTRGRRLCVADFFRDAEEAQAGPDVLALQTVTVGAALPAVIHQLFEEDRYREYWELSGLAAQLADALAEYWHAQIRAELGLAPDADMESVLRHQGYQGSRYSFGYPATPDLTARAPLFKLLHAEEIGMSLTEGYFIIPEFSTDALVVHHPQARYFSVH